MKKPGLIIALLLAIATAAFGFSHFKHTDGSSTAAYAATELTAARSRFVKSTEARGLVKPKVGADIKVGSQSSGIVRRMLVGVGEKVTRGQLLAELDDVQQLAQINLITEQLQTSKLQWDYSQMELDRLKRLAGAKGFVSDQSIAEQHQKMLLDAAQHRQNAALLKQAQILLGYTRIVAPIDGTISTISTYKGETVAASLSAPTFVRIIDLDRLEIQAFVDEADIGSVHVKQAVDFRMESFPDSVLHGTVRAINPSPEVENNVVDYVVLIDFTQPDNIQIRPEMTVRVNFILDLREAAVVVSGKALIHEDGVDFVVVRQHELWTKQPVRIGLRDAGKMEILDGLHPGDKYLADKNEWKRLAAEQ